MQPHSLRPKAQLTWGLLVIGLALGQAPATTGEGQEPAATAQGPGPEEPGPGSSKLRVVTPEQLELLLAGQKADLVSDLSESEKARAISVATSYLEAKKRYAREGRLTKEGCYSFMTFLHPPPGLLGAAETQVSLEELIRRTELVIVAEVLDVQSGIVGNNPGSLVRVQPREYLKGGSSSSKELYYNRLEHSFTVEGELLCYKREGVYSEQAGDLVLIVAQATRPDDRILPRGIFKIQNGLVMPQGYSFLSEMEATPLSSLSEVAGKTLSPRAGL